jgi:Bacterial SH3 domain
MCTIKYAAVMVAFFATASLVCAIGLVVAPYAFVGSIPTQSEAPVASNAPKEHSSLPSPSSSLLGSQPKPEAQEALDVANHNGDWVEVVDAVNMRSGASSAKPTIEVQQEGATLRVVSHHGNWIEVVEPESGLQGWVYKKYVRSIEPALQRARVADASVE